MNTHTKQDRGFIALMATIIISLVLLVMTAKEGVYGWSARFNVLGTEAKEQASALAEGCAEQAFVSLIANPQYTGGATTTTAGGVCHVFPIQLNYPVAGLVTIKTQAVVRGSYANLNMAMHMNDLHLGGIPTAPTTGTLFITTHVVNDSSGAKNAGDFTMQVAANPPSSFAGSESGVAVTVQPGAYSVSETVLPDYSVTTTADCSGTIIAGEIKFCTITNDDITTTLTLVANVVNNNSGTSHPNDFELMIDGVPATLGTRHTVTAGSHTVSANTLSGYAASAWGYDCAGGGTITMALGQNKTCIINFDDFPPPAPVCADTVMMLDRTGSMFPSFGGGVNDIPDEKAAAKALVALYSGVTPLPQIGIGRFGDISTSVGAEMISNLTTTYTNLASLIDNGLPQNPVSFTNLAAAITVGSNELSSERHIVNPPPPAVEKEKVLVLISDGDPNEPSGTTNGSVTLAPDAEGASTAWSANTGTKIAAVASHDNDTTYVTPLVMAQTYTFANANVPVGASNITVTLHAVAKRASGSTASLSLMAEGGGVSASDGGHTLSSSYADYTWTMTNNPLGGAWTPAEVNAWTTKFGVRNTSAPGNVPRVTQMYVVVSYTIVSSGNPQHAPATTVSPSQWNNSPTKVTISDNAYATSAIKDQQMGLAGFGFSIPAGATIQGIQVTTEAKTVGTVVPTNTDTLYPEDQGSQNDWSGDDGDINETGTPNCSSDDSVRTNDTGERESVELDISEIPDGSVITSVNVTSYDRPGSSAGGTYRTFVRQGSTNYDATGTLTSNTPSGSSSACNSGKTQTITIPGAGITKSASTVLEIGVLKLGNSSPTNREVRVGALNAVITYTPPSAGALAITLSSNGGSSWTGTTRTTSVDATESVDSPSGNSTSDLWGRSWAPGDFNNFALRVENESTTGLTTSLDQVTVTVYYSSTTNGASGSLAASAVGTFNNWPPNTGTAVTAVASNDNDTTSISNAPVSQPTQTFVFPNASIPTNATNISVTLHAVAKETNGSNGAIRLLAEKGAAQVTDSTDNLGSSYSDYSWTMNSNPMGGSWTAAEVNAWTVRFGVRDMSTSGAIPHVTQIYLIVNYSINTTPEEAALAAADAAKLAGVNIFTIYFGSGNPSLLANLASGPSAVPGHQNGSTADSTSVTSYDTNFKQPTSTAAPNQWNSPTRAFTSDNSYATSTSNGQQQGYTNFGFLIPPTATISGITIDVEAKSTDSSGCSIGVELSSDNGVNFTSVGTTAGLSNSDSTDTFGGSTSLWGRAWAPSNFLDGSFVARLRYIDPGSSCTNNAMLSVDRVRARVHYTENPENADGDYFFVAPSSSDMQGIFNFIGAQVCPASLNVAATPPPTNATLIITTQVTNNNGGAGDVDDFTGTVSATNASAPTFTGSAVGVTITVDPGSYAINANAMTGYSITPGVACSSSGSLGPIIAGETRVCTINADDIPPPPPPPNLNLTTNTWQEVPTAQ